MKLKLLLILLIITLASGCANQFDCNSRKVKQVALQALINEVTVDSIKADFKKHLRLSDIAERVGNRETGDYWCSATVRYRNGDVNIIRPYEFEVRNVDGDKPSFVIKHLNGQITDIIVIASNETNM